MCSQLQFRKLGTYFYRTGYSPGSKPMMILCLILGLWTDRQEIRHPREMGVESFTEGGSEIKTRLGRKVVRTS